MPVLDFNHVPEPKKPKNLRRLLGLGAITALISVGVAFATPAGRNITNSSAEFGQGYVTSTACDSEITVTPVTTFVNGDPGYFALDSVNLTGISTNCDGKWFVVRAYDNSTSTPLSIWGGGPGTDYREEYVNSTEEYLDVIAGEDVVDVFKFTIESFDTNQYGA